MGLMARARCRLRLGALNVLWHSAFSVTAWGLGWSDVCVWIHIHIVHFSLRGFGKFSVEKATGDPRAWLPAVAVACGSSARVGDDACFNRMVSSTSNHCLTCLGTVSRREPVPAGVCSSSAGLSRTLGSWVTSRPFGFPVTSKTRSGFCLWAYGHWLAFSFWHRPPSSRFSLHCDPFNPPFCHFSSSNHWLNRGHR